MNHIVTIKRLTLVVCTFLAFASILTATTRPPFLTLENGDKVFLSNTEEAMCDNAIVGGIISGEQTGCANPSYDPTEITNVDLPTGGTGDLEYIWISTTDNPTIPNSFPVWSPIYGSTGASYDPGPISQETFYQRCARRSGCVDYVAESNFIKVSLDCCDNVTYGGTIEQSYAVCATSTNVTPIISSAVPTGGSGQIEYIWLQTTSCSDYFDGNADWSIVPNSNSINLDPGVITETTCYIRCARRYGCTDYIGESNVVTITLNAIPNAAIAVNSNPNCDDSGKLTATGTDGDSPYTYAWNTGANTNMISDLGSGTYTVTVTDANGCTATASESLVASTPPTASASSNDLDCNGDNDGSASVAVTAGNAPFSYNWSNGGSTATINGLGSGIYSVTVTDANGCTATASTTINQPSPLTLSASAANATCGQANGSASATAAGGTTAYTYTWSNNATGASVSGLAAGTYSVTATDANGCTATAYVTVANVGGPTVTAYGSDASCNGYADGTATASTTNGTGTITFLWSNGATTAAINGLDAGTYTVTATDANGCQDVASVTVGQPTAVTLSATASNETCNNNNASASATAAGGTPGYTYAWSNGDNSATASNLSAGTYSVTATDANGCTATAYVTVANVAAPTAAATGSDLDCNDDNDGTASVAVYGGNAPFSYNWSNGGSTATINGLGSGIYSVTVTDANGCTATASTTINQPSPLTLSASAANATCGQANGSASATAAGGTAAYTYTWSNNATGASVSGLAAGTYSVTATDANGCTATAYVTVANVGGPTVTAYGSDASCNGYADGTATASTTNGTGTITFLWSNGATTAAINGLDAGTYTVTATDANGCQDVASVTVGQPTAVTLSATASNETCNNNNASASATAAGGTPGYTYAWSNGDNSATASNLSAGTYSVTATDANGCTATAYVTVANVAAPTAAATGSDLDCNDDNDGTASVAVSGGTAPFSYNWSNAATTAAISGLDAGTYSVTVTDANGCTATASTTINQPSPLTLSASAANATCGQANGSASATAAGGTAAYTYTWSNNATGASVSGLAAGTYSVTATDANGCTATAYVTVANVGGPTVTAYGSDASCNRYADGTATASTTNGTGTITFLWSNGATTAAINGLDAGTYTVTATDANGCQDVASVTVGQPTAVTLSATASNETCNNNNASASATAAGGTPGYTYAWSNGDNSATASNLSAGTYSVTATDANGCTATAYVTVANVAAPTAAATGSDLDCNDDNDGTASVAVYGGTAPFSYNWSNAATTAAISGLDAGTYSVTVTDANGCTATASTTINQPSPLTLSASAANATCGQANGSASATAAGGTAAYTYTWSNNATGASVSGLAAGTYSVTATDANGCTATAYVTVANVGGPTVTAYGSDASCNGYADGTATASTTNGTGTITFLWSNGATTAAINGLDAGTYTVTATDANGCQDVASVTLGQPTAVTLSATASNETCNNNNASASATAAGGTPGYTYAWSNGDNSATASNLSAGTYSVTATDANGCTATAYVTVANVAAPTAAATGSDLDCNDDNDGTASVAVSGGTAPFSYNWSNTATTAAISGLDAGTYSVTVTDANGCTATASTTINQPSPLTLSASAANATCGQANGSASATAAGGTAAYTYTWSNNATGASVSGLAAGTYSVTATDANGCTATAYVTVANVGGPTVTAYGSDASCNGYADGTATASTTNGTGTITFLWSNGATTAAINGLDAGTYTVTATDANGCQDVASVTVGQPTAVTLSATASNETCNNNNASASATAAGGTPGYTYAWSNGDNSATASNLSAGTYSVTATDANGCTATAYVTVANVAAPTAAATGSDLDCNDDNDGTASVAVYGGTAPFSYNWSNAATTAAISGLDAGTYSVTVTDANGCTATASTTINQPSPLTLSASAANATCGQANGSASATAAGGTAAYTYTWSNNATGASISGLAAGTYSVTATDANGCTATAYVTVANVGGPTATAYGSDASCNGYADGTATASTTNGTGTITFLWSNGATTAAINGLDAGTYTVTATDANGCQDVASVTLGQPTAVTLSATASNETCNNNNASASATAAGGTPGYTYAWSNGDNSATASNLSAGTYSVTATDANGCTATAYVTVANVAAPTAAATGSDLDCNDDNDGTASVAVSGGTAPFSYNWSNAATTAAISGLDAGTYSVTVTDANGCTATASTTINQPSPLTLSASAANATCGQANGSASATAAGGTAAYTYTWSNNATGASVSGLAAGTYSVTATDANGCTATAYVTVANVGGPTVTVVGTDLYCNSIPEGSASANVTGGTGTVTYLWNNGSTESSLWGIAAGTYSVTITDENGCQDSGSVVVSEPSAIAVSLSSTNETCDNNNGTASVSATGGTAPYTYRWNNTATATTISNLTLGTYTVVVTDANGCTASQSITITNQEGPDLVSEGSRLDCNGGTDGTAWANATGGRTPLTYLWSNGATIANIDGLSAGSYSVTVTDANGCTAVSNTIVTEPTAVSVIANGEDATCGYANGTVTADAAGGTPGYTYLWNTTATTATISNLLPGTYSVTATDANGCTATTTYQIDEIAGPSIVIGNQSNVTCNGGVDGSATVSVTAGTSPYGYAWSNGANTATATGLAAGGYIVTVTDDNGCTTSTGVTITEPSAITAAIAINAEPLCDASGNITASAYGGTAPYTYAWNNGSAAPTLSGLAGGTYTVTITDANGCSAAPVSIVLADLTPGVITTTTEDNICFGDNAGKVTATITGGKDPIIWAFSGGTQNNNMSSYLAAGTYTVTATDANGCISTRTFAISAPTELTTSTTTTSAGCDDTSGQAVVMAQGGTTPYTYLWSTGATTATNTEMGPGTYTVTVTDANGCTSVSTAVITDDANLVCSAIDVKPATCYGGNDGQATAVATDGRAPYTYAWSNGANQASVTNLVAGTYTYTVTDANGCSCTESITITQPEELVCSALVSTEINTYNGQDGVVRVIATGGNDQNVYNYLWSDGGTDVYNSDIAAGTYTVTVTDINGCSCESSVTLAPKSQLGNFVFEDLNADGIQDMNEEGIAGITVTLTNLADSTTTQTVTDNVGYYLFDGLDAGDYKVTFDLPVGSVFSPINTGTDDTVDSDINEMGMTADITLGANESNLTIDAGIVKNSINIGDYVWIDTNQDGIQDPTEFGISDISVTLTDTTTNVTRVETTDANGRYLFTDVAPGTYTLSFTDLSGSYTFTTADAGDDDLLDSDVTNMGMTDVFTVVLGANDLSFDAGIRLICDNVTDAGTIGSDQKLCGTFKPDLLTEVTAPIGGNGTLEYLWLRNESGVMTTPGLNAPGWVVIPNSNNANYNPGIVSTSTFYVRCVRRNGCTTYAESNVIHVQICDLPAVDAVYNAVDNCVDEAINFEAVNAGAGSTYRWSFSGADIDTASTRVVTGVEYGMQGDYVVTLTVTSAEGCSLSRDFDISIDCPTDLGFRSIQAKSTQAKTVMIDWTLEKQASDFEYFVEQSVDGISYQTIGSVMGSEVMEYNFEDESPKLGSSYYRIKHIDQVGDYVFSDDVQVIMTEGAIKHMFTYPNPAVDFVKLELFEPLAENGMLYIIDGNGRTIRTVVVSANTQIIDVDLSTLERGMYFIEVQYDGFKKYRQKIVKAIR